MKLVSWNVNGLRSAEDRFLKFIDQYQPDLVLLQEVRASTDQLSMFLRNIHHYTFINNFSGRTGYGGTAVYVNDKLKPQQISVLSNNQTLGSEGRAVELKLDNLVITNLYIPNGNRNQERLDFKRKYYQAITTYVNQLVRDKFDIVIGGDFNVAHTDIDLFSPQTNHQHSGFLDWERRWFTNLLGQGMVDTFRLFNPQPDNYTWWHMKDPSRKDNKGWRYDYFLVSGNFQNKIIKSEILRDVFGSDHCPIMLEINYP